MSEDVFGRLGEILKPQNKEQVKQHLEELSVRDIAQSFYLPKEATDKKVDHNEVNEYLKDRWNTYNGIQADFDKYHKDNLRMYCNELAFCIMLFRTKGDTEMEELYRKVYDEKSAQLKMLNEAERNGDDIFELDDYTLLPTEQTKDKWIN